MDNILIVSGHTDLNDSVANRLIIDELKNAFPNAEFSILSELYPNFEIDVKAEQEKLVKADIVVLQFPVFWYSMPSIMHRWIELVFVHGFSHGSKGDALKGKILIPSFTFGASEDYPIDEIVMQQIKEIAALCQFNLQDHICTPAVSYALRNDTEQLLQIKKLSKEHARKLINRIRG